MKCHQLVLVFLVSNSPVLAQDYPVRYSFERGFDGWNNDNQSWSRISVNNLRAQGHLIPNPRDTSSQMVLTTSVQGQDLAILSRRIHVPPNSNLEITFACLALGWKTGNNFLIRMSNPLLQVIYDETVIFHLDTAINENLENFSLNKWNEIRLFSSYEQELSINISFVGSPGISANAKGNLVAIDDIQIHVYRNETLQSAPRDEEPEVEVENSDGQWLKIMDEDQIPEGGNGSVEHVIPEFCLLLPERGHCFFYERRYFFNQSSGACETFSFSGCGPNENNFRYKKACERMCMNGNTTEEEILRQEPRRSLKNLTLDFDQGFEDWDNYDWQIISYNSDLARGLNLYSPDPGSRSCAGPLRPQGFSKSHPKLMHPIQVDRNEAITITLSLKLVGPSLPSSHGFFESFCPGFHFYLGSKSVFNLVVENRDKNWHSFEIKINSTQFFATPARDRPDSRMEILRIESWPGRRNNSFIVMNDLVVLQTNQSLRPSTIATDSTTTTLPSTTPASTLSSSTSELAGSPCQLAMARGPCDLYLIRFFYNWKTEKCENFVFGGCKGNGNNFKSLEECETTCSEHKPEKDDPCISPLLKGSCSGSGEKFHFDFQSHTCSKFVYSGCGGNGNNFDSLAECQSTCKDHMDPTMNSLGRHIFRVPKRSLSDCLKPITSGDCQLEQGVYGFNQTENQCVPYIYSGCGGSDNLFLSHEACKNRCEIQIAPRCRIEHTFEPCLPSPSYTSVWVYSEEQRMCVVTVGCSNTKRIGNEFSTSSECERTCLSDRSHSLEVEPMFALEGCLLRPERGSCHGSLPRFYYEPMDETCHSFTFSGCHGNGNNFQSFQHCLATCHDAEVRADGSILTNASICEQPKLKGPCRRDQPRFFYNPSIETCEEFRYGGCKGSRNNFPTRAQCEATCLNREVDAFIQFLAEESETFHEESTSSGVVVAEIFIGIALSGLVILGVYFGFRYYQLKQPSENYRIFKDDQREPATNSESAFDNPVYSSSPPASASYHSASDSIQLNVPQLPPMLYN